jgi:hypothetical protein
MINTTVLANYSLVAILHTAGKRARTQKSCKCMRVALQPEQKSCVQRIYLLVRLLLVLVVQSQVSSYLVVFLMQQPSHLEIDITWQFIS